MRHTIRTKDHEYADEEETHSSRSGGSWAAARNAGQVAESHLVRVLRTPNRIQDLSVAPKAVIERAMAAEVNVHLG
ncbi:hypothetical protein MyNCGM683_36040 [Achromobacter xylosoxidans]